MRSGVIARAPVRRRRRGRLAVPIICGATLVAVTGVTLGLARRQVRDTVRSSSDRSRPRPADSRDRRRRGGPSPVRADDPGLHRPPRFARSDHSTRRARLQASVSAAFGDIEPGGARSVRAPATVLRGAPLGYRVDDYHDGRASVAIWNVAIAGTPGQPAPVAMAHARRRPRLDCRAAGASRTAPASTAPRRRPRSPSSPPKRLDSGASDMCHSARFWILVTIVAAAVAAPTSAIAAPDGGAALVTSSADEGETDDPNIKFPAAPSLICLGGQIVGIVGGLAGGAAGDAVASGAASVGGSAMGGVVSWAADGAAWLVGEVVTAGRAIDATAARSAWFAERYDGMLQLAACSRRSSSCSRSARRSSLRTLQRLLRAAFVLLPCAMLLTFAAVTLTQLALRVTDEMTAWVLRGTGSTMREAFTASRRCSPRTRRTTRRSHRSCCSSARSSPRCSRCSSGSSWSCARPPSTSRVAFLPLTLAAMVWERTAHWSRRLPSGCSRSSWRSSRSPLASRSPPPRSSRRRSRAAG